MARQIDAILEKLSKDLTDKGLLIEAGWAALRHLSIPQDATEAQVREMRMAFFAGAQHLFASIMTILEEGEEPTDADLDRMNLISGELERFAEELKVRHTPTKGTA